jgi:hypothetical protein
LHYDVADFPVAPGEFRPLMFSIAYRGKRGHQPGTC